MDSPLFDFAKKLVRDQAFVLTLNRVVEKVVDGKCICDEPERRAFKCPIHESVSGEASLPSAR